MASLFNSIDKGDGLRAVLDHLSIRYLSGKLGWQKIHCPNADGHSGGRDRNPSCSMRLDVGVVNCHSCGFKGDWARIAYEILGWKVDKAVAELALQEGKERREDQQGNSDSPFLF